MRRNACVVLAAFACSLAAAGVAMSGGEKPRHGIGTAVTHTIVHSRRYMVATKLARGIASLCRAGSGGCALRGQAWTIEDVGHRERLSPAFMVGASFTESSGGDAACSNNRRNIWGLASCSGGYFIHGPVPAFTDWRSAFTYFARFVKERWPSARTAWDLGGYCQCSGWGNRTSSFMSRMGFGGGRLSYP